MARVMEINSNKILWQYYSVAHSVENKTWKKTDGSWNQEQHNIMYNSNKETRSGFYETAWLNLNWPLLRRRHWRCCGMWSEIIQI